MIEFEMPEPIVRQRGLAQQAAAGLMRRQARDLLWARDMRESLAAPEAAAQVIAELQQLGKLS